MCAAWDAEAEAFDREPDHGMLAPETRVAWWTLLESFVRMRQRAWQISARGTRTVSVLLAVPGYEVTGIDLSPRMIDQARAKAQTAGHGVRFDVGNAGDPGLNPGAFDVVFARLVLWALSDPRQPSTLGGSCGTGWAVGLRGGVLAHGGRTSSRCTTRPRRDPHERNQGHTAARPDPVGEAARRRALRPDGGAVAGIGTEPRAAIARF